MLCPGYQCNHIRPGIGRFNAEKILPAVVRHVGHLAGAFATGVPNHDRLTALGVHAKS